MTAFHKYLESTFERAAKEAEADFSRTIDARHILLALAADQETTAGRYLTSVGLDHGAVRTALEREFDQSLKLVGTQRPESSLQADERDTAARASAHLNLGLSVQQALKRGLRGLKVNPTPAHVLLGILRAEVGTVPHALSLAGYDRAELAARLENVIRDS